MISLVKGQEGFSLVEVSIILAVFGVLAVGVVTPSMYKLIRDSERIAASKNISTLKDECESNYAYGIDGFTKISSKGYELENNSISTCFGDPNHGFINLVPKSSNENPSFHYDFQSGLIFCSIDNVEISPFPECKKVNKSKVKHRCNEIGDWVRAQQLLIKGHSYLDRDKDGEACETLKRKSNKPKYGKVVIDHCYDGDTCTTSSGEKIRLACIDTPELRGKESKPNKAKDARDFLNNLIQRKEVNIRRVTEDRYGRTVGELSLNGVNLQQELVAKGYAQIYEKYSDPCPWAQHKNKGSKS